MKTLFNYFIITSILAIILLQSEFVLGQNYNSDDAVTYADYWAYKASDPEWHNPAYHYYNESGGNDCANFVSQCLKAGGLNLNKGPGIDSWGCIPFCDNLHTHLTTYQNVTYQRKTSSYPSWFTKGDVLMLGISGDPWDHAMFAVTNNVPPLLDGHTNNRYHTSLSSYPPSGYVSCDFYHIPTSVVQAPSNDNCPGTSITSNGSCKTGTVAGATGSYGANQCSGCNCTSPDDKDVYYYFTAYATSHTVTVSNYASNFDAVIELRSACGYNTSLGCYDPSGAPTPVSNTWNNLTVGQTYYIRVFEYNNTGTPPSSPEFQICVTHSTTTQKPDLIVQSAQISSTTVVMGQQVTATFYIKNQDTGNASTSVASIWFTHDQSFNANEDYYLGEVSVPTLSSGVTSSQLSKQVTIPTGPYSLGTWYIMIGADATNSNPNESDENNNQKFVQISLQGSTLAVTPTSITLGSASNSSDQINVTSNISWTASDDASWLTVSPASGSNNETVTVTATSANTSTSTRSGTVTITGSGITRTVSVTQSVPPITPSLTVNPTSLTLGSTSNSSDQINVTSNVNWTASDDASWLTVTPGNGSNNGAVTVTATTANPSTNTRSGIVTITGSGITRTISITQDGTPITPALTVAPTSLTLGSASNSSDQINVTSNVSWTASGDVSWLNVSSTNGSNNETVIVSVTSENISTNTRIGTVTITGSGITRTVTVTQQGANSTSYCSAGSNLQDEYIGGVQLGSIHTGSSVGLGGYQDITNLSTTMHIGVSSLIEIGLGNDKATDQILIWVDWNKDGDFTDSGENVYSTIGNLPNQYIKANFAPPTGAAIGTTRMRIRLHNTADGPNATPCGNATWGEVEDYSINVASGVCSLSVLPTSLSFTSSAGNNSIALSSNSTWTISDDASWITVIPGSGSGNSNLTVSVNANAGSSRSGTITVSGCNTSKTITVNQALLSNCAPGWQNPVGKQYSMGVYAQVKINDVINCSAGAIVGAFKDDECLGITSLINGPAGCQFNLTLGSNTQNFSGIQLKLWDPSTCEIYELSPVFDFANDGNLGTINEPKLFSNKVTANLQIPLVKGWNWISFNVIPDVNKLSEILNYNKTNDDAIKTSTNLGGSATYYDGVWYVDNGIQWGVGYKLYVQSDNPGSITITGTPAPLGPINLTKDWNWLGYCPQVELDADIALNMGSWSDNNAIKTSPDKGGQATFFNGKWWGPDYIMKPGLGYLINLSEAKTLTYNSSGTKSLSNITNAIAINGWENPVGLEYTMGTHVQVTYNNKTISTNDALIGAFKDGECIGVTSIYNGPAGNQFQLSIGSNLENQEGISLRFYDPQLNRIYELDRKFKFEKDVVYGTIANPNVYNISDNSELEEFNKSPLVYPNPFNDELNFEFTLDESQNITIDLFDVTGKLVAKVFNNQLVKGNHKITWQTNDGKNGVLNSGVYISIIKTKEATYVKKVILQKQK